MRYRSEEKPVKPFSTYLSVGQAAIEFEVATIAAARLMLSALVREYKAAGKTGRELRAIMDEEVEAIVTSAEMPAIQRDLLTLELDLHKYEVNPPVNNVAPQPGAATIENSPAGQTDNTYEDERREAERVFFLNNVGWLERLVADCKSLPRPEDPLASLWNAAAVAVRGEQLKPRPKREPSFKLVLELARQCFDFGKAELLAYAGLLRRQGVPASEALIKAEEHAKLMLVELRRFKWAAGLDHLRSWFSPQTTDMGWQAVETDILGFMRDGMERFIWLEQGASDLDANGTEQRVAVDDYIAEVNRRIGKKISRTDIWKEAGYGHRKEFERWQRGEAKAGSAVDKAMRRVLREKPHLKPKN